MRIYSQWNPPKNMDKEYSDKPSLTDQLANEDLNTLVERFLKFPVIPGKDHYDYEGDDIGALDKLDDNANVDVAQLDNVDCLEILAGAERLATQLRKFSQQSKQAENELQKQNGPKVVQDIAPDPKDAN